MPVEPEIGRVFERINALEVGERTKREAKNFIKQWMPRLTGADVEVSSILDSVQLIIVKRARKLVATFMTGPSRQAMYLQRIAQDNPEPGDTAMKLGVADRASIKSSVEWLESST